jgi:hypothetical protein
VGLRLHACWDCGIESRRGIDVSLLSFVCCVGRERQYTSCTVMLEHMIGNAVISEVDVLTYVVLNRAEEHVPYGELVCTTDSITL